MNTTLDWEAVKEFYTDKFGIDGWLVEMYANLDILCLCASGASNQSIEKMLEIPIEEVEQVIKDTFDFEGWGRDLPINPYRIFCSYKEQISSVQHFQDFVLQVTHELTKYGISFSPEKLFYMCETMYDIERKIQDEWI